MGLDPVHCQGNLGSLSTARKLEPAVSQEHNGVHGGNGADYLQAAVWQCPLLAALARWQDNGTDQSLCKVSSAPVQGLHHHPGGTGPRLVGSKERCCSSAGWGRVATFTPALLCLWRLWVEPQNAYASVQIERDLKNVFNL